MKILIFNLSTDTNDSALSFTVNWVNSISTSYKQVYLITLKGNLKGLNPNVVAYRLYTNKNKNKIIVLLKFYFFLVLVLSKKIDRCFCHMNPLFLSLTLGVLKLYNVKSILWYTHPSITLKLKFATFLSDKVLTASKKSFPLTTTKLIPIGHAIETSLFESLDLKKKYISCVGRISRVKNIDVLIRSYAKLKSKGKKLLIIGDTITREDKKFKNELVHLINDLNLQNYIFLRQSVSRKNLVRIYNESFVHVNLTSEGFLDKVAIEAMACGTISLSSNSGYKNIYGEFDKKLLFKYRDENDLLNKLNFILNLDNQNRNRIEKTLRKNVVNYHSIDTIGSRIEKIFNSI